MKKLVPLLILIILASYASCQNTPKYIPKTVVVKIKPEFAAFCYQKSINQEGIQNVLNRIGVKSIHKLFPNVKSPASKTDKNGNELTDLTLIYEISYQQNQDVFKVAFELDQLPQVQYAEPHLIHQLLESPNDPYQGSQYYLANIKAQEGWNTTQGDSTIVIGITDTGVDIDHEDLIDNIMYNYNDPVNGIDDDGDGYIDNFRGWDLAENDNNPQIETSQHGIRVSGIAAARTNNGKGIAGVGYKTKFLPIKIIDSNNEITRGYEGIVYAALHGCQIINCSWGGVFPSLLGQDVINYAVINCNAMVVAACGNSGNEDVYYPASFEYVYSVAATNALDHKWLNSTYGTNVDFSAPGESIFGPMLDNTYTSGSGTSYASPIAAGCAALVKARYPEYSGIQLGELLRVTTDVIDTIQANIPFAGKLGNGRINLFKALNNTIPPSVVFHHITITDHKHDLFRIGDTVFIYGTFTNYLSNASYVTISASTISPYVSFENNILQLGALVTNQSVQNIQNPISFILTGNVATDEYILIRLSFSAGGYSSKQYLRIQVNKSYTTLETNQIKTTVSSQGKIGYFNANPPVGNGFIFNSRNLLYEGGFIVGHSASQIVSSFRKYFDFEIEYPVEGLIFPMVADTMEQMVSRFNDNIASEHRIGITIQQKAEAWYDPDDNFIIYEYTMVNPNDYSLQNIYAGIFADWDIIESNANRTGFNATKNLGYTFSHLTEVYYAGIEVLTPQNVFHYAFDNIAGGNEGIDISDNFSLEERWFALTNNRHYAGADSIGNDVAELTSTGPFTIPPYDSIKVAFALLAGENQQILFAQADRARQKYGSINSIRNENGGFESVSITPNPSCGIFRIDFMKSSGLYKIQVFDLTGRPVKSIKSNQSLSTNIDLSFLTDGIYIIQIAGNQVYFTKKVIINH